MTPDAWHRIAIAVNIEELWGKIYIDGQQVGSVSAPDGSLDGRWSLDTAFEMFVTFFNDDNNESEEVFVNSIQVRFESLNSGQILALGGAAAAGVPEDLPPVPSFVDQWIPAGKYAKSDTELSAVINPGDTTISSDSVSLKLNGEAIASDVTSEDGVLTVKASGTAALVKGQKYELALSYTDSAAGEQAQSRKFEVPVYFEDFDSVELGPPVDELAVDTETAWTRTGPEGWVVDASGVPGNSEDHVGYIADDDGDDYPDNDGVTEWAGWSFADYNWWVQVAGDQSRSQFSLARNVVAVADPDEWDDKAHADSAANGWFKTFMTTPEIDVSGIAAGTLFANFHSSWRPEFDSNYHQEGYVLASYDGAEPVEILTWVSDPGSANYHDHNQNEVVILPLSNPEGAQKLQLTFGMREAGNDWWWAIDNLVINAGVVPPRIVTQPVGTEINEGEGFALSVVADGGQPLNYQWAKDGVAIDGANSAEFAIGQASVSDGGNYSVTVTNEAGEIASTVVPVAVQASLGITIWSENFDGLELGPNVDEGLAGEQVWTKTPPESWVLNDEEVPGTWAWQGIDDEEGYPENDGVTEWAGWSFADVKWWSQTAGDQQRSQFKKAVGAVLVADGDEWDDSAREAGMQSTYLTTEEIPLDGIMENSVVLRFHSSWRPDACCGGSQKAVVEVSFDDGDPEEVLRWESDQASEFYHDHSTNETVNLSISNPAGAKVMKLTFSYIDATNNWWWAIDNIIVAGEPQPIFAENFDSLELGPFESSSESGGDGTDWTADTPTGWVMTRADDHGPTAEGDAVTEFDGWTFMDPVSWNATAGQDRAEFTKGTGVIAVGDSDEYDDLADAKFNASLSTPAFSLDGVAAGTAILVYDSSWRQEPQNGTVSVSFDGGDPITLLTLTPDTPTAYNETVTLPLGNPDGAKKAVITWDHQGHNNWWWAIDNIKVTVGKAPAGIVTQLTSVEATEGDGVSFKVEANGDEPIFYKWFKGDTEIAGADGPVLELSNVSEADTGSYTVEVSNSAGSATSNAARLAVLLKPGSTLVFAENFDSLELGPFVSDSESGGDGTDWTATAPEGWASNQADDHGPTAGGDDVVEFDGWTFLDPVSWNATAGQSRGEFTKGTGVVAVGDSDEYDDKADAKFNASLSTPAISIAGIDPESLILKYDSSWRKEPQSGTVSVAYDGGDAVTLVTLTPDTPTGYNDTVTVRLNNPEGASSMVITWDHQGHNNWWWAIDNIEITGELQPLFSENFDSLELGPFVSDSESGGDGTDWTATAPEGWVQAKGEDHGPTAGGDVAVEFDGWTFFDPVSWNATAGQARGEFTKGTGVIAVGDSDEYDDKADAKFNASLATPQISLNGVQAGSLVVRYDSSWRQEPQSGTVSISFDGGDPVTLVTLTPDTPTAYNETVVLNVDNPAGANFAVITWDHQGYNNWWWAIDNIVVYSTAPVEPSLPDNHYLVEGFDSLELGPFESGTESGGDGTDWTATAPSGWTMVLGPNHGPTAGGDAVKEFNGWTFMDPASWDATAGQDRAQFTKGIGVVAVGDSDEYDDAADAKFDAALSTPSLNIAGAAAGSLYVTYDSSWRQEPQQGKVLVSFDGGEPVVLLELTPETPTAYNETVTLPLGNPSGASSAIITWDHQGHNNWWWAIDNVRVFAKKVLPDGYYFMENFDDLELGPFVSDSESGGDGTDWTATAPDGWVQAKGEDHGPTAGGDVAVEFDGWTFLDPVSWNATAGQDRALFTKGTGVVAVGDSDEYDDKADAKFNASLSTPAIDISASSAGSLLLTYDSSWRQEPQSGKVLVSYDGGEAVTLLELTPDTPTAYDESVELELNNPEGASSMVVTWDHQGHNNWWWAIDNIAVKAKPAGPGPDDPAVATDKATYISGEAIVVNFKNGEGNPKDWVGLYGPDMTPGEVGSLKWAYVSGSSTAGEGLTEGVITFADGLPAGDYVARFFINDGYTQMANTEFNVVDPPSVATSRAKFAAGSPIVVNFSSGPGNAKDWIGLYRPDMTPGEVGSLKWAYVSGTQTAGDGLTDGSVTLEGLEVGDYFAIFFENDGYTQLAKTSFSVVSEDGIFFAENFDSLELGPFVSDSESGGDGTDWTATGPEGWVMVLGDGHGPTADGDDVVEFDGWTFLDPVSWNATAGQDRAQFTKGSGVVAVGDSDEYDDKVDAKFNASLATPAFDISTAAAGSLVLTYDSSWRQEPQNGKVTVTYDGGAPVTLLELTPDTPTAYNETVTLSLNNPAGAKTAVVAWDHQGHNNWWWAIDNIMVTGETGSGVGGPDGLSSVVSGLSTQALDSLIAHYDGKHGVKTEGNSVVSWTPIDSNGGFLDNMIVQSTQKGGGAPELITYDGSGKLTFDDTEVSADGRYLEGALSNAESKELTVFWVGNYSAEAPFATSGTYVYNIGINSTSHQRDDGKGGFVVEQYNGTTYSGDDITAYDGVSTVWSTVLTADSHAFYANGKNLNVGGTPSNNVKANASIIIGAYSSSGYDFVGDVEQLIIFGSALSDADRKLVEGYLGVSETPSTPSTILIDFAGTGPNSAGASPDPWVSINNLVQDEAASLGDGVTITALDDGFNPNNPAQPGEGAEYDGVSVPQEARNDYLFKIADAAGTTARMRIDGLPAGTYNVTVFEGRQTDASQFAKIWTGEEPAEQNTGDFAKGSATVQVVVEVGQPLWYMHLEDGSGGVSGMIIRPAADTPALSIVNNGDGTVTLTFDGKLQAAPTVNGPWQDVDAASPLTIPVDEVMQFGRAVK
ncbi:MAG: hypothetical protein CMO75_00720 [Verrucomicrobiales bacterium]|nr:hypothetical protein [Verrucomicrobiales bacterium]